MVEDEIECRKIIYEQYYSNLTTGIEEQIKKVIIAKAKDNKCLIFSRATIICGIQRKLLVPNLIIMPIDYRIYWLLCYMKKLVY